MNFAGYKAACANIFGELERSENAINTLSCVGSAIRVSWRDVGFALNSVEFGEPHLDAEPWFTVESPEIDPLDDSDFNSLAVSITSNFNVLRTGYMDRYRLEVTRPRSNKICLTLKTA